AAQAVGTERLERSGGALRGAAQAVDESSRRQEQLAQGIEGAARADSEQLRSLGSAALDGVKSSTEVADATAAIVRVAARHAATVEKFEDVMDALWRETVALAEEVKGFLLVETAAGGVRRGR